MLSILGIILSKLKIFSGKVGSRSLSIQAQIDAACAGAEFSCKEAVNHRVILMQNNCEAFKCSLNRTYGQVITMLSDAGQNFTTNFHLR